MDSSGSMLPCSRSMWNWVIILWLVIQNSFYNVISVLCVWQLVLEFLCLFSAKSGSEQLVNIPSVQVNLHTVGESYNIVKITFCVFIKILTYSCLCHLNYKARCSEILTKIGLSCGSFVPVATSLNFRTCVKLLNSWVVVGPTRPWIRPIELYCVCVFSKVVMPLNWGLQRPSRQIWACGKTHYSNIIYLLWHLQTSAITL